MEYRCPICKRKIEKVKTGKDKADTTGSFFPFCSERCKLVDLNAWFESDYTISSPIPEDDEKNENNSEN